ncbi:MAG TPA: hypothetical protein VN709_01200 [Terriglobales bacterium]|nr:hypothetical protein [Terriglobales bacterium]
MQSSARRALLLVLTALLIGCAQVGPVLPPSRQLPRPITDFRAVRSGPTIALAWTAPQITSDGVRLHGIPTYSLCAWPGDIPAPLPALCDHRLLLTGPAVNLADIAIPRESSATLALAANNSHGQSAGWSNPVVVPLQPVAPPPQPLTAVLTADGVVLHWPAAANEVNLYRLPANAAGPALVSRLSAVSGEYIDTAMPWNSQVEYWMRSVAGQGRLAVESADSNHVTVSTADVFPPPVPAGLEVVTGASGADLSWDAVAARNLAGYNVYRRIADSDAWLKLNPAPLPTPVFHDADWRPGSVYRVTSVSIAGVESAASASPHAQTLFHPAARPRALRQLRVRVFGPHS